MNKKNIPFKELIKLISSLAVLLLLLNSALAQVTFEKEIKISDKGLFFDGQDVNPGTPDRGPKYDFVFGSRITPHGDCIKEYDGFIFMTWYRGGKNDRHVMLSRYNTRTGVTKTIEFGHQHNGFQNQPHLGESHNTIAVGICPIDGTIHMLYDMHSYSEDRPANGSLANDYFRYTFSKKNAATVPDNIFNINQFVKDSDGDYKHLKMRNGTDYRSLTYPNFFLNKRGELFMWIREGGNTNGAYKFCKYDGNSWTDFTQFNVMNARRNPNVTNNWGLYGDIKFSGGKMRIGFAKREGNNRDRFTYNNGFYYAYTDDPNGKNQWKDVNDNPISLPVFDAEKLKVSEPTDVLGITSGVNTVTMRAGADWIVTDRGDIHSITTVDKGRERINVHTYRKAGDTDFRTSTGFPGGNIYTFKNQVYLIGLSNGRIFVERANGGTDNWTRIYQQSGGKTFRHGNVYISEDGKLYFYLMERKTGSAQPIYLQVIDLDLNIGGGNRAPEVSVTSPADGATFELGQEINLSANASDPDGNLDKVNFKINDAFYRTDSDRPFETTFTPTELGTYKIAARAIDTENEQTEVFITINVVEPNNSPTVSLTSPSNNATYDVGEEIPLTATASDVDGNLDRVNFFINDELYHSDLAAPYSRSFTPTQAGTYVIMARAIDTRNNRTDASVTITVIQPNQAPTGIITDPVANTLEEGYTELYIKVDANDPDGDDISVMLKIDGQEIRTETLAPFEWGQVGTPNANETIGLAIGDHVFEAIITDAKGLSTTITKTITITEKNIAPTASFTTPAETVLNEGYTELVITVDATDPNGDDITVLLKINGQEIRSESVPPYEWGRAGSPNSSETLGLTVGDHIFEAVVTDAKGLSTTISKTITVDKVTGTSSVVDRKELTIFPNPSQTGMFKLSKTVEWSVFNLHGNNIDSGESAIVDLSNQPSGLYFFKANGKVYQIILQ